MKAFSPSRPLACRFGFLALLLAVGLPLAPAFAQAPVVSALSPTRNLRNAPRAASVAVTYSQPMSTGAATTGAVQVFSQQRGGRMSGAQGGTASVSGSTLTFDPATDFRPGETVLTTVTTAAQSSVGVGLARGHVYGFTAAAGAGPGTFFPGADPDVGSGPRSVAVGDVDGDGDLDLLTANYYAGTVSVRLNNGAGGFGGGSDPGVGTGPNSVAVGDVDGDGDLDLLTANNGASTVSVRLNQAPATLTSLSPSSDVAGTNVTLTGTNFTGATGVSFNGTAATTFAVTNATTATATVPAGATTGSVTITTPAGTSNGVVFTLCAPQAIAKPATVQLGANGTVSLTAATVNNGSTASCSFAASGGLSVTPSSFTCANLGPNTVTLTVTDAFGNTNSTTATVTVVGSIPAAAITVVPQNTVNTGGVPTNLYLGYGPQSVTLRASAGGTSYAWTGPAGLSSTSAAAPVFTATQAGSFTYMVTITNQYGCSNSASVTLTVRNVRCGNKNDKVLVCHSGNTLCIVVTDVASHLSHGNPLGPCAPARGTGPLLATGEAAPSLFEAFPNPFGESTTLRFRAERTVKAQLRVYNAWG